MDNYQHTINQDQANDHTCKTLLNCYIREFSHEILNLVHIDQDMKTYVVVFPASEVNISGKLAHYSAIGEHEYSEFLVNGVEKLDFTDLVQWMTRELQLHLPIPNVRVIDFAQKVANSYRNLTLFLKHSVDRQVQDYLSSEQSLLFGHPMHPFPKNTLGFTTDEVNKYSPELRTSFQLCYMAIRHDVFREEWVSEHRRLSLHESVESYARRFLQAKRDNYRIIPVHPWQYEYLLLIKAVKDYVQQGRIIPLGSTGPMSYPTTSVRTVYVPEMRCNIKLSLNIQITNMTRNNSGEQMIRTLDAAKYLQRINCFEREESTRIAYEEGVCTCHFQDESITKLFTIAYRPIEFDESSTFVMSSLIEAPVKDGPSRLLSLMDSRKIEPWFRRYLEISLLPIVRVAYEQGIHFEAHSQNVLLTTKNGMPDVFVIRDLEGVSVVREKAMGEADLTSPLFYSEEECWARTDYYFIVNHLGSLIRAMARDIHVEEEYFWEIVREILSLEYEKTGNEYVFHLLNTKAFYAKKNLISCLIGNSETPSYVAVNNAMKKVGSEVNGAIRILA